MDLFAMKEKQLGRTKYIRFGLIIIPAGIFLKISGRASAGISVS